MDLSWLWCSNVGLQIITNVPLVIFVRDDDNGGGHVCVRVGDIRDISAPSFQLCCELKTAPKK